jgi:hypothetical protein
MDSGGTIFIASYRRLHEQILHVINTDLFEPLPVIIRRNDDVDGL